MASAVIRLPGAAAKAATHHQVTLKTGTNVVTLPITSPASRHSNLTPSWVTLDRPGREPIMRKGPYRQRQFTLAVTFWNGGKPVEVDMLKVATMSSAPQPMSVAYGPIEGGVWWLTDMSITSSQREFGSNAMTKAEVALTFTSAPANSYKRVTTVTAAAVPPRKPATPVKAPTRPKTYIVKKGDTLTAISVRIYGNASHVGAIAKANRISDPNRVYPGQVLKLP